MRLSILPPYDYWSSNNQKIFTLQITFPRSSVLDLHINDSNPIFQILIEKRVHHETNERFWDKYHPKLRKNIILKQECLLLPSH